MPTTTSFDVVNLIANLDATGQVEGKMREQYLDYSALLYREKLGELSQNEIVEK